MNMTVNGRAQEAAQLVSEVSKLIIPWIQAADDETLAHIAGKRLEQSTILRPHPAKRLGEILGLTAPSDGLGEIGLVKSVESILKYSVNTFCPGFLDKLVACTNPPGLASELLLASLNTNLHVYHVSPALTTIEKQTTKELAKKFGLTSRYSGGISVQGGSASNLTSLVVARNTVFPEAKLHGINGLSGKAQTPVLFTSTRAHYSFEKAAQVCGLGSSAAIGVPIDQSGRMIPSELERLIVEAKAKGQTPFYVAATAGTTVLGAYDPLPEIAAVAQRHGLWFHIDAAWGGGFIFSDVLKHGRLTGSELADSIGYNPHKMLGVPAPCSFLLVKDLRQLHSSNSLPAGYLFHGPSGLPAERRDIPHTARDDEDLDFEATYPQSRSCSSPSITSRGPDSGESSTPLSSIFDAQKSSVLDEEWIEPDDLGDLTLQCGRRGDSLKLFLAWQYYGSSGFASKVEQAYANAIHVAQRLSTIDRDQILLISPLPLPCLQVCFYYAPGGKQVYEVPEQGHTFTGTADRAQYQTASQSVIGKLNSNITRAIANALVYRGFMVDYAPAREGCQPEWRGDFFRLVVHIETPRESLDRLIGEILILGKEIVERTAQVKNDS